MLTKCSFFIPNFIDFNGENIEAITTNYLGFSLLFLRRL